MTKTLSAWRIVWITLLVGVVVGAGIAIRPGAAAKAGVRQTPAPEHFLAGSERSVPILQEISRTLKQIDSRLSRIETSLVQKAAVPTDR